MPTTTTIRDEISGQPRIILNPLRASHICVNRVFWYDGYTSVGSWSCPAVITKVDKKKRRFKVRSLDDMREQHQWYDFDVEKDGSSSRETMRLVDASVVEEYLTKQRERLEQRIEITKKSYEAAQSGLAEFDTFKAKLKFV